MSISFKVLKEEGYLYQLQDGSVIKLEYRLKRLTRNQVGTLSSEGTMRYIVEAVGTSVASLQPVKFPDPECIHKGANVYLTSEGETVHIRPQLRAVERTIDGRGVPVYKPMELDWLPDSNPENMVRAIARPGRTIIATDRNEVVAAAEREKAVLEWLFGYRWFFEKGNVKHPAYAEWSMCVQIIRWGGFKPDVIEFEQMRTAARTALDALLLVRLSDGDIKHLMPGRLAAVGDAMVQRKITSRIEIAGSFEDLFVELYTAAWHKKEGRTVSLSETPGFPDVKVRVDSIPVPIFIECKRLSVISKNRIQQVIKKASNQIGVASQGLDEQLYGAVLLDFTGPEGAMPYSGRLIPSRIEDAILEVRHALSGEKNHHVKSAIVAWDEYKIIGRLPDPVQLLLGRRSELVNHSLNRNPLMRADLFDGYVSGVIFRPVADELR